MDEPPPDRAQIHTDEVKRKEKYETKLKELIGNTQKLLKLVENHPDMWTDPLMAAVRLPGTAPSYPSVY